MARLTRRQRVLRALRLEPQASFEINGETLPFEPAMSRVAQIRKIDAAEVFKRIMTALLPDVFLNRHHALHGAFVNAAHLLAVYLPGETAINHVLR